MPTDTERDTGEGPPADDTEETGTSPSTTTSPPTAAFAVPCMGYGVDNWGLLAAPTGCTVVDKDALAECDSGWRPSLA